MQSHTDQSADDPARYYDAMRQKFEELEREAVFAVKTALDALAATLKIHSVASRVKTRDSYLEKVQRRTLDLKPNDIGDIVGLRIICLFLPDLPQLVELVLTSFQVLESEDKVEMASPDSFGYMSYHAICMLREEHAGPRYDSLKGLKFEIQCRTILMDAWANVSHHLAYKGEASIPEELRRDFHALSGLFYVADRHFQLFYQEAVMSAKTVEREVEDNPALATQRPLDRDSITGLLRRLYPEDRELDRPQAISELVEQLVKFGYTTVGDLERDLRRAYETVLIYEEDLRVGKNRPGFRFSSVGLARTSIAMVNAKYALKIGVSSSAALRKYRDLLESAE